MALLTRTGSEERAQSKGRFAWLRPPKPDNSGSMSLFDHLRELRYRLIVSFVVLVLCTILAAIFYQSLLVPTLLWPINVAMDRYQSANVDASIMLTTEGVFSPMMLMLKVSALAGLILSCPFWLYQVWAYIAPALYANEKKNALKFLLAAIPLFLSGVLLGYFATPQGFAMMLEFTPRGQEIVNLQDLSNFLSMEMKLLIIFGLSFLLPVVIVTLNIVGVVSAKQLRKGRMWSFFLAFVFGAVATPSGDPFTMSMLAVPICLMYVMSEVICGRRDAKQARREASDEVVIGEAIIGEPDIGPTVIGEPDIGPTEIGEPEIHVPTDKEMGL